MLDLQLRPPNVFRGSGRSPRLNRKHPLFPQAGQLIQAVVAQGPGLIDLNSGTYQSGAGITGGSDENGPYISNLGTGAQVTFTGPTTSYNFMTFGCIFKLGANVGGGFNVIYAFGGSGSGQTGIFVNGLSIEFTLAGGDIGLVAGQAGHTYFALWRNAVATAGYQKILILLDLTDGVIVQAYAASADNLIINPINAAQYLSGGATQNRFYAGFICGSVLVPPAVQPAACFWSVDQMMAGLKDPWGLWYG